MLARPPRALGVLVVLGGSLAAAGCAGSSAPGPGLFRAPNPWNEEIASLPPSPSSDAIIAWLASHGGWGTGEIRIDTSLVVLQAHASTPFLAFTPTSDFYTPDCDLFPFPVPASGALEGEEGYRCEGGGDCHLLVVDQDDGQLYEMWRADIEGGDLRGGCAVRWDLDRSYGPSLRGENCTSTDAAGLPVAALTFSADEVAAGAIDHAIRFILPNDRIRAGEYVHPATHSTGAARGGAEAPPYGARLRLRADYPIDALSPGAQVIAQALQRYGMILADGGEIALTAQSDRFTAHTWAEVGVDPLALADIAVTDMEVVDLDATIPYHGDCQRVP